MFRLSIGGMDAARSRTVYRHALVGLIMPLFPPLAACGGAGWSPLALAIGSILMIRDPGPTLTQRFESALSTLDAAMPRRCRVPRTYYGFVNALTRDRFASKGASHRRSCGLGFRII